MLSSFGELQPRHGLDDKFSILEILYKGAYFEICMPFRFLNGSRLNDEFFSRNSLHGCIL